MRAKTLKEMRRRLGVSADQLAYRLGVAQSSVVRLEQSEMRGAISLNKLKEAAEALGCEVLYHIHFKQEPTKKKKASAKKTSRTAYSSAAQLHQNQDIAITKKLSPASRLQRAFELSDFLRKLQLCSK